MKLFLALTTSLILSNTATCAPLTDTSALQKRSPLGLFPSTEELAYCAWPPAHWVNCGKARLDAGTASDAALANFSELSQHNGRGDAFRHCYWSALMTVDMSSDDAKTFGD